MYTSSKKNLIMKIDSNHPTQDMYVKIIILSCYNSGFSKNSFIVCQNKNACTYHLIIDLKIWCRFHDIGSMTRIYTINVLYIAHHFISLNMSNITNLITKNIRQKTSRRKRIKKHLSCLSSIFYASSRIQLNESWFLQTYHIITFY